MTADRPSFTCPRCHRTSHHPDDAKHGYCGACHEFTGPQTAGMLQVWDRTVAGHCPMGCGQTLYVGSGGHITCARIDCPDPCAVDRILFDAETEHVVEFGAGSFTIRHPLRERLGDALMQCALHDHVTGLDGPPVEPGRYRARVHDGMWTWEELPA